MKPHANSWLRLFLAAGLCAAGAVGASDVRVVSDSERVDISGQRVDVQDADDHVVVDGDWRKRGQVQVGSDDGDVLVDLGAVVADDRIQVDLAGDILFDYDSATLAPAAAQRLAQVAQLIRARSVGQVHVIGHTDAHGADSYNQRLSLERAESVIGHLVRAEGIPRSLLIGAGAGARHPVAPNTLPSGGDNPEGRARNRRVEMQIATREGVALGPGRSIVVAGERVTTPETSVDPRGVTTDEVRVDIADGRVDVRELAGDDATVTSIVGAALGQTTVTTGSAASAVGAACARMCAATAGRHEVATVGCIEATLEEFEYDFDADACDELEDAMVLGRGNEGGHLCYTCQRAEGFGERECAAVEKQCFRAR